MIDEMKGKFVYCNLFESPRLVAYAADPTSPSLDQHSPCTSQWAMRNMQKHRGQMQGSRYTVTPFKRKWITCVFKLPLSLSFFLSLVKKSQNKRPKR